MGTCILVVWMGVLLPGVKNFLVEAVGLGVVVRRKKRKVYERA